jgi:predicted ferric reductase
MNDDQEKFTRLRRYEARERRHRIAGVLFNGLVLFLVWLLYREDFDRNRFAVRDAFYRLKFLFISMGLLATFATTLILAFRLNSIEKEHDKTEPDL